MKTKTILIVGDALALLIVTLIGFSTHGEAGLSFLPRAAAVYVPLCIAWFLLAPWFGLFEGQISRNARQLWRPALAMFLAAPLAAVLRGLILDAPVIPIFALVLAGTSALGMVVWRGIYLWFLQRGK